MSAARVVIVVMVVGICGSGGASGMVGCAVVASGVVGYSRGFIVGFSSVGGEIYLPGGGKGLIYFE